MTPADQIVVQVNVTLFSSSLSYGGGPTTVWSTVTSYPPNVRVMPSQTYYVNEDELARMSPDRFWQAFTTVVQCVAPWTECYEAEAVGVRDTITDTKRGGFIPQQADHREILLDQLVSWLHDCCEHQEFFLMLCTDCGQTSKEPQVKFRYQEQNHKWFLELTDKEYRSVQTALQEAGFSSSLFHLDPIVHHGRQLLSLVQVDVPSSDMLSVDSQF